MQPLTGVGSSESQAKKGCTPATRQGGEEGVMRNIRGGKNMATSLRGVQAFFRLLDSGRNHPAQVADSHYREPRTAVHISMLYRLRGEVSWRKARMEDLSLGGIRFRCERCLPEGSYVEVSFRLPAADSSAQEVDIFFTARTLRCHRPSGRGARATVAARIAAYRSETMEPEDVRQVVGEVRGPCGEYSLEPATNPGAIAVCALQVLSVLMALALAMLPVMR